VRCGAVLEGTLRETGTYQSKTNLLYRDWELVVRGRELSGPWSRSVSRLYGSRGKKPVECRGRGESSSLKEGGIEGKMRRMALKALKRDKNGHGGGNFHAVVWVNG